MAHYKLLLDPAKFLSPQDFPTEREVTINRLSRDVLPAREGEQETSAPMLYVRSKEGTEYPRPMKIPKSVLHGLSLSFGVDTDAWVGQKIAVYSTRCLAFGEIEECLRVRFSPEIDAKVRKWLKKRKASPSAYIYEERK